MELYFCITKNYISTADEWKNINFIRFLRVLLYKMWNANANDVFFCNSSLHSGLLERPCKCTLVRNLIFDRCY